MSSMCPTRPRLWILLMISFYHPFLIRLPRHFSAQGKNDLQFPLHDQRARPDNLFIRLVLNDENEVSTSTLGAHPLITFIPGRICDISHSREHSQAVQESNLVIRLAQWADGIVWWEKGLNCGGDEGIIEEVWGGAVGCHCVYGRS